MKGYMYILGCADGSFYTSATKDLKYRLEQHQNGEGAKHTKGKGRLPVKLAYYEEFENVKDAFYREKKIKGWRRKQKGALVNGFHENISK
jgi:putative endonuclease